VTSSIVILWGGAAIAYLFPMIISIIGFLGGICCVSIIITFPGNIFYLTIE